MATTNVRSLALLGLIGIVPCQSLLRGSRFVEKIHNDENAAPETHHDRDLMAGHMMDYHPLDCNTGVTTDDCVLWSTQSYTVDSNEPVVIPCGSCVQLDVTGTLTLNGGLNVDGMLYIPPPSASLTVETPHIFVQGELVIDSPDAIIPSPTASLEFVLTGTDSQTFVPHTSSMVTKQFSSLKPVVVAGGTLSVQGMDESCPTWTRIQSVQRDHAPVPNDYPQAPVAPATCSNVLVQEDFNEMSGVWDGHYAPTAGIQTDADGSSYYQVSGRTSSYHGPRVNLGNVECIVPNEPYLLQFRYRLSGSTAADGTYTSPYVKMIREKVAGGKDWLSPTLVYSRGSMSKVAEGGWHHAQYVVSFPEDQCDSTVTSNLYLYLSALEIDATVDLDDFRLELAPTTVFPSSSEDACTDLFRNPTGSLAHGHAYPFYPPNGGMLYTLQDDEGWRFFRMTERQSEWSKTLSQDINPGCLVAGAVYKFQASVRIHSTVPRSASVQVWTKDVNGAMGYHTILNCPQSSFGEWVVCQGLYTFQEEHENSAEVWFHTRIGGDSSSMVDWANVTFAYQAESSSTQTLHLEEDVSDCWGPGAEVLITSHTIQWDDAQVAMIESVDSATGSLTLTESILSPITLEDDALTGVEIALLSRNVVFRAEEDPANPQIGGHLIVLHTPDVAQTLMGVEMNNFGQQGSLGRYPIHFHMCESAAGSVVKKNLVRNSNQRCVVIHGTNDVDIIDNVAYDTSGHCMILEDGAEQNNRFIRNLVAVTKPVDTLISADESDNVPSSFWITNPVNTWESNVAAGSAGAGYWLEVSGSARGPSKAKHPDMQPNRLILKLWKDNVSHSNSRNGLQTYPQSGYKPTERVFFQNQRSFRNRAAGVFFHAGYNLTVSGGYFADNRVGVDVDVDHSDLVKDAVIVGVSEVYQKVVDSMGAAAFSYPAKAQCTDGNPVIGVRMDASGTSISNVTFSGFGPASCSEEGTAVFGFYDHRPTYQYLDSINQVTILDDSETVNLCRAVEYGVLDIAIHDEDGSIAGLSPGSSIVSDTDIMKADSRCTPVAGTCAAYCPNVLVRSLTVLVPSYASPDIQLHVEGTSSDGQPISPVTFTELYKPKEGTDLTSWNAHRTISVKLPAEGSYTGRFSGGSGDPATIWPVYASMSYEDAPSGSVAGPEFDLLLEEPEADCEDLITNGDAAGGSTESWQHVAGGVAVKTEGPPQGSGYSLLNTNRSGRWHGLAQYLDTRCMVEGATYAFSAMIKLTREESGDLFVCDINAWSSDALACPRATIRSTSGSSHQWPSAATMIESDKEWNMMQGSFTISEFDSRAGRVALYLNGAPTGIDIQMAQVSFTRVIPSESPSTSPTVIPSESPSASPTPGVPEELHEELPFDYAPGGPVSMDGDAIVFSSNSGQDATALTRATHEGDFEITVEILERNMFGSGYQAALALFFGDPNDDVGAFTSNDNGYGGFESTAVATIRDKLYPTINHCWFAMHSQATDGSVTYTSGGASYQMLTGGKFKLSRSNGFVSAHHYQNDNWVLIGSARELPEAYKTSPLKIGMRIKREYKADYYLKVLPTISALP